MRTLRAAALFGQAVVLLSCGGPTCPATEPSGRRHSVREVIEDARTSATLEGRDVTVCGFVWVEYEGGALWQDADAFERLRGCIATAATCVERANAVRLTLGGNLEKWRGFHNEEACVRGVVHTAKVATNPAASRLEVSVKCADSP